MKGNVMKSAAFSIIEVLIGIFVFSLGLISIYALIASSLSVGAHNKHTIIASNLAREQIELFVNIRDTNYKKLQVWNKQNPFTDFSSDSKVFQADHYYSLFLAPDTQTLEVYELWKNLIEGSQELQTMSLIPWYKICIDMDTYVPCQNLHTEQKTVFYKYLYVSEYDVEGNSLPQWAFRLVSKVIWKSGAYSEYDISTIVTDWRRI